MKPRVVFVQNPSVLLSLFAIMIGRILKKTIIVDAHNAGVYFEHDNRFIQKAVQFLNDIIIRRAYMTIVTNDYLSQYVKSKMGNPFILPDPIPVFSRHSLIKMKGIKNVVYICMFSQDEPYEEVVKSANYIDSNNFIYITGKYNKKKMPKSVPHNIVFTGFIPDDEYISLIFSADVVVDLTYREHCLVCGAYEAIAAEKPLVLSDKHALKNYFSNSALYTDNTAIDIAVKIREAIEKESLLKDQVKKFKNHNLSEWRKRKEKIEILLNDLKI